MSHFRVLSGMRPTGQLHLGHLYGVLKNWVNLQEKHHCFFFVADWHALTTEYDNTGIIAQSVWEMVIDWLAVGIDPEKAILFVQSQVPEHAELHLLLSMSTPLSWLERMPSYKDQQQKLKNKDLSTYGFLGYPLLQSADILIYKADQVPVGEDQVAHIEFTRELARRFNHLYGREQNFEEKSEESARKMGKNHKKRYDFLRKQYQEQGNVDARQEAIDLIDKQNNLSLIDKKRLLGYLTGETRVILPEPAPLLTETAKMPGLDGQKMSKSYGNTIALREPLENVQKKIRTMPTDPARIRRTDCGDPAKCPVWQFHAVYSSESTKNAIESGCRSANIGCLDCKQPIIDAVLVDLQTIQERAKIYTETPDLVQKILREGSEKARVFAQETLTEVRQVMGLT